MRHAWKAPASGIDGLIIVANGGSDRAGIITINEVRGFFKGTTILSACPSRSGGVATQGDRRKPIDLAGDLAHR